VPKVSNEERKGITRRKGKEEKNNPRKLLWKTCAMCVRRKSRDRKMVWAKEGKNVVRHLPSTRKAPNRVTFGGGTAGKSRPTLAHLKTSRVRFTGRGQHQDRRTAEVGKHLQGVKTFPNGYQGNGEKKNSGKGRKR